MNCLLNLLLSLGGLLALCLSLLSGNWNSKTPPQMHIIHLHFPYKFRYISDNNNIIIIIKQFVTMWFIGTKPTYHFPWSL